ncbi:hypothetical protein UPYG_G00174900 [Umbra pygmaea]|uniref:Uncharacterized protein n=1 Tax=Umbra pygmaea TaxID=75934 RepID=A0ABD0WQB5_UMBPY
MDSRESLRLTCFLITISLVTTKTNLESPTETGMTVTPSKASSVTTFTTTVTSNQTDTTATSNYTSVTFQTTIYANSTQSSNGTTQNTDHSNSTTSAPPESSSNPRTTQPTASAFTTIAPTTQAAKTTEIHTPSISPPEHSTKNQPETHTTIWMTKGMHNDKQDSGLNKSEKSITIFFSVMLGVFIFGISMYLFSRCKQNRQYSHRLLYNNADVGVPLAADDTLVISGGLYDGTAIYNPTMTTSMEDADSFDNHLRGPQSSQFRMELVNEQEDPPGHEAPTFNTFHNFDEYNNDLSSK